MNRVSVPLGSVAALFAVTLLAAPAPSTAGEAEEKEVTLGPGVHVSFPSSWQVQAAARDSWAAEHFAEKGELDASMAVHVEVRTDHAEAVRRLAEIETEYPGSSQYLVIGGWPALERKVVAKFQRPGEAPTPGAGDETSLRTTTAIAAGNLLVRLETLLQPQAQPALADQALAIGRQLKLPAGSPESDQELRDLQSGRLRPEQRGPTLHAPTGEERRGDGGAPAGSSGPAGGGAALQVNGAGEIEAAVSANGQTLVTNAACTLMFSTNFGASFSVSTVNRGTINLDGDCTITWGRSGNFYLGQLGGFVNNAGPFTVAFFRSAQNGQTFGSLGLAVNRLQQKINVDQPHVAADRWNRSNQNGDRVYVVWQETNNLVSRIACSLDSGANWGAPVNASGGTFSFPRVAVGSDGMVYVVSRSGGTAVIDKFSSCDNGLVRQPGFPRSLTIHDVPCPVPGLDRCNNGNTLSSPTIAVDDTNAQHVYIAWADSNGAGEDILVAESKDGGQNFGGPVAVSSAAKARRFLPWLTTWNGVAHAGWYDRRNATSTQNDLTRYFRGSASVVLNTLTPGPEVDLSGTDDPQCASGWACGVRSSGDCQQCSNPPPPNQCPVGSSSGCPKYGDYNGDAAGGGRVLHVWASATAPSGLPAASAIQAYASVTTLCGGRSQPCCPAGSACNAGLVCDGSQICSCGNVGQPCCANATCSPGLDCDINGLCSCGALNQVCCNQNPQCSGTLICGLDCSAGFKCIAPCGHRGQKCCGGGCGGSFCYCGLVCAGGNCACGGDNQPCCIPGGTCGFNLVCSNGFCHPGNSACGQCRQQLAQCLAKCPNDALCQCLCRNSNCTCLTEGSCGPCVFESCGGP